MKLIKKTWFIPLILTVIILVVGVLYIGSLLTKKEQLSSEEIQAQLEAMYKGTVDSLVIDNGVYIAEMTRAGAVYEAKVDAVSGNILSMNQLSEMTVEEDPDPESKPEDIKNLTENEIRKIIAKEYEDEIEHISLNKKGEVPVYEVDAVKDQMLMKVVVDAVSGEIISAKPQGETNPQALISREEAIDIAFTQLKGEVEYVKFKQTDDGGFYVIEIEQDNDDDDDLEAVIEIHAITGKILSVIWED